MLCWDIDGTLLTTNRAGIGAWVAACGDVFGTRPPLDDFPTAGLTDWQIAAELAIRHASGASASVVRSLVQRYEAHLPERLADRPGGALGGVRELLEGMVDEPRVLSLLLTGNTRRGADAKLRRYGLDGYFSGGAFAEEGDARVDIARRAWAVANRMTDVEWRAGEIVVIGDTPHDIACGQAIGARTLALATGSHDAAALVRHGAWRVLPALPAVSEFLAMVLGHDG